MQRPTRRPIRVLPAALLTAAGLALSGCANSGHNQTAAEPAIAPGKAALYAGLNGYHRTVTTDSPEAQRWFDQGIQFLYGFNHDEAIRSFRKAAEVDPTCAMAHWGEAYALGLHINNPQMGEEQSRLAYEASRRALDAYEHASPVERKLIAAVGLRYEWPTSPENRPLLDQAYADAMERVYAEYPNDPDVCALFAESLMNLQPWDLWTHDGAPKGRTLEILDVLEHTIALDEDHPGANHFYIHAIEASPWPEKGTASAERLVDLVPGSGHLVHMPSHIFIRTGRYGDAAEANVRAIAADETYFSTAPAPDFYSLYYLHNVHFLSYASMMEGRYETALAAARKIESNIPPEFLREYVKFADGFMPTVLHVYVRFGKWDEILAEPEPEGYRLLSRAERHYARAVALANLGRLDEARGELASFDTVVAEMDDEWRMGNNPASSVVSIARNMAAGEIAFKSGDSETAFGLLREAVAKEDLLVYDEPPGWMQPVRHALGALLLADGRAAEAETVYREDLARHANNGWSLLGLQQSLRAQGKAVETQAIEAAKALAWERADVMPAASCYCHPDAGE